MADQGFSELLSPADALASNPGQRTVGFNQVFGGSTWDQQRSILVGDAAAGTGIAAAGNMLYNGSTYDRQRSILGVAPGANTDLGVAAVGIGPGFSRIPADDTLSSTTAGAALQVGGAQTVIFQITGTWVGTLTFQATYDAVTWFAVSCQNTSTGAWVTTTTANGNWAMPIDGYYQVRGSMVWTSGTSIVIHKVAHISILTDSVAGDTPQGIADSGAPVKIGGKASSTKPATTGDGNRQNLWVGSSGQLMVGFGPSQTPGDGYSNTGYDILVIDSAGVNSGAVRTTSWLYNGTTWDRPRNEGSTLGMTVGGSVGSGVTDAGNPVKIGGLAKAIGERIALTAVTDGQRVNARYSLFGDAAVALNDPESGLSAAVDHLRHQLVATPIVVVGQDFSNNGNSGFDPGVWTTATASGGGAAKVGSGWVQLTTSANATGSVTITTFAPLYIPGTVHRASFEVRVTDTGLANNTRRWGAFSLTGTAPNDGFYFELNGTTLNACYGVGGTITTTASGSWSRQGAAAFTLDTNMHLWEIIYDGSAVIFLIDGIARHTILRGTIAGPGTLQLPLTLTNINNGSTATNESLQVRTGALLRYGGPGFPSTNATNQTSVASSASNVVLLAASGSRKGAAIYNDSTQVLFLLLGSGTSSATVYTVQVIPGYYYEVPYGYTGAISGIWAAANGNARITEFL